MKVRSQRTHLMGTSNREKINSLQKSKSILERSFNKSTMLQATSKIDSKMQSNLSLVDLNPQSKIKSNRQNPFGGTNLELQSARFDKMNIKEYRYAQKQIKVRNKTKDFSDRINQSIKDLKKQFQGKQINTHKLYLFKQAILKNNRERTNFLDQFKRFVQTNQNKNKIAPKINQSGLKSFIKSFGYDLNQDEIQLFLKLNLQKDSKTLKQQKPLSDQVQIDIKDFLQICTKDNIYLKTIDLTKYGQNKISHKIFIPRHFQILRNKFSKIKEAFKIYRNRNQQITYNNFVYTMKKLDINDLIMPKPERDELFQLFADHNGFLNSEGLLGAIAAQQHQEVSELIEKTGFQNNLKFIEEKNAEKQSNKQATFNLKKTSFLEYQNHLQKARTILNRIRQLSQKPQSKKNLMEQLVQKQIINRFQLRTKIEDFMMRNGYNFSKQKYQSFISYLDYDTNGNITSNKLQSFLLHETDKQAEARIQRQTRNLPPIVGRQNKEVLNFDRSCAIETLRKIKQQTLNPEVSCMFSLLDKDKDGFILKEQFQNKVKSILVRQNHETIKNLSDHFYQGKQYLNRNQFIQKYNDDRIPNNRAKSVAQWTDLRRSGIQEFKKSYYQRPTKYSAWPHYLNEHNLSLIQAPTNSGVYIDQQQRFNNTEKHNYGLEQKLERQKRKSVKIAQLSHRNRELQQKKNILIEALQKREEDKNFKVRLVKQQYNKNLLSKD